MAFLNNWFEARGDAFKIVRSCRRPLPKRTETIGPWLEVMVSVSLDELGSFVTVI